MDYRSPRGLWSSGVSGSSRPKHSSISGAAPNDSLNQTRRERRHARFYEVGVADTQSAGIEIEVFPRKPQSFAASAPAR